MEPLANYFESAIEKISKEAADSLVGKEFYFSALPLALTKGLSGELIFKVTEVNNEGIKCAIYIGNNKEAFIKNQSFSPQIFGIMIDGGNLVQKQ